MKRRIINGVACGVLVCGSGFLLDVPPAWVAVTLAICGFALGAACPILGEPT